MTVRNIQLFGKGQVLTFAFAVLESPPPGMSTIYDLVANVTHESTAGTTRDKENTVWKLHVRAPPVRPEGNAAADEPREDRWLMMQDLIIEETAKELIFLGETVLQVSAL